MWFVCFVVLLKSMVHAELRTILFALITFIVPYVKGLWSILYIMLLYIVWTLQPRESIGGRGPQITYLEI